MTGPKRLAGIVLYVQDPVGLAKFYTGQLGMVARCDGADIRLGYGGEDADLILRPAVSADRYVHSREDRYWKIGITLPDVDMACDQLTRAGVQVSAPRQFQDIGYMAHLADPEGFQIELLQHTFEGQPRSAPGDPAIALGGGAAIGQVTYRTADIEAEMAHYRDALGMRLLSVQPVTGYGFDLYFLAFTDECPPEADLTAVINRPWLWQRPYTQLEFQHVLVAGPAAFQPPKTGAQGEILLE